MPDKAHAMTQAELLEKAGVITKTAGQRAFGDLLAVKQIQRMGKGGPRSIPLLLGGSWQMKATVRC